MRCSRSGTKNFTSRPETARSTQFHSRSSRNYWKLALLYTPHVYFGWVLFLGWKKPSALLRWIIRAALLGLSLRIKVLTWVCLCTRGFFFITAGPWKRNALSLWTRDGLCSILSPWIKFSGFFYVSV